MRRPRKNESNPPHGRKRKVLFVVNADWFFLSHRLKLALECQRAGFEVVLCAGGSAAAAEIERAGIRFVPLPIRRGGTNPLAELRTLASLAAVYRREKPDLVHHVTIKPVLYGSLIARIQRTAGVVNAVSGLGYAFITRPEESHRQRLLRKALWTAYHVALDTARTRVVFQNRDDMDTFIARGLISEERAALIPGSGVDLTQFAPRPFPQGPLVAMLPARMLWDKGVGEFVQAAKLLRPNWPTARFVLIGRTDPDNPAAISKAQLLEWAAEGYVEWWGDTPHADMPAQLEQAHVVVLPSYREGLPLVLAEAAAIGRAAITTDVPGCRDAVRGGQTGWLVESRSADQLALALSAAFRDPEELQRRGENATALARARFGADGVIQSTLALYRELLERNAR